MKCSVQVVVRFVEEWSLVTLPHTLGLMQPAIARATQCYQRLMYGVRVVFPTAWLLSAILLYPGLGQECIPGWSWLDFIWTLLVCSRDATASHKKMPPQNQKMQTIALSSEKLCRLLPFFCCIWCLQCRVWRKMAPGLLCQTHGVSHVQDASCCSAPVFSSFFLRNAGCIVLKVLGEKNKSVLPGLSRWWSALFRRQVNVCCMNHVWEQACICCTIFC